MSQGRRDTMSKVLSLNIGGTHELMTTRQVLCEGAAKGSNLEKIFSSDSLEAGGINVVDDKIFLDRDGKTFQNLINYLRNDCVIYPKFETDYDEKMFKAELSYWNIQNVDLGSERSAPQSSQGPLPKIVQNHLNNSFRNQYPNKAENLENAVDKNNISYVDEDTGGAQPVNIDQVQIPVQAQAMDRKMSVPKLSARTRTSQGTFQKRHASMVSQSQVSQKSAREIQNDIETEKSIRALEEHVEDQSFVEENKVPRSPSTQEKSNKNTYQNFIDAENVDK